MFAKAVFFDRDGIVNKRIFGDYVKSTEEMFIIDDFYDIFSIVKKQGFLAILVTNQQCIGKRIISTQRLNEIHNYMQKQILANTQYQFDDIFFCPDLADTDSKFRKPEPGMFLQAIERYNIDTSVSYTIGDSISDVQAGKKVNTTTILIGNFVNVKEADYIFMDLKQVSKFFNKHEKLLNNV